MAKYKVKTEKGTFIVTTEDAPVKQERQPITEEQILKSNRQINAPVAVPGGPILPGTLMPPMAQESEARTAVSEGVAEELGARGHPYLGATAGLVAGYPDVVAGIAGAGGSLAKNAKSIPSALAETGPLLKKLDPIGKIKQLGRRLLMGPNSVELGDVKANIRGLKSLKYEKEKAAEALRIRVGGRLEGAREAAKVPQRIDVKTPAPKDLNKFSQAMKGITKESLQGKSLKELMELKDIADEVVRSGVNPTQNAFISRGNHTLVNAIAETGEEGAKIAKQLRRYGKVKTIAENIPNSIEQKRVALQNLKDQLMSKGEVERKIRQGAGWTMGGGAAIEAMRRLFGWGK